MYGCLASKTCQKIEWMAPALDTDIIKKADIFILLLFNEQTKKI